MLFENNNYLDLLYNTNNASYNTDNKYEGFYKGNMFPNEYESYKNYTYIKPKVKNEREKLLMDVMASSFAINDYNLYLDLYPNNNEILNKYKLETENLKKLKDKYEKMYGPLCIDNGKYQDFKWILSPWPWDKEDSKYV